LIALSRRCPDNESPGRLLPLTSTAAGIIHATKYRNINYVATDNNGLTATSTRSVVIEAATARARFMCTGKQYRVKAAEFTELLRTTRSPAEIREFRTLEQSYVTLAENDEWLADNLDMTNSPGADENLYSDIILAGQEKNALGRLGAGDATPFTGFSTKMQQLFDDAASKGGLLQTATLRGQFARFLQKHKEDDFS
jgi:hypothetical protein